MCKRVCEQWEEEDGHAFTQYLEHALAIGLAIRQAAGVDDRMLLRGHAELVVECVVQDLLHVILCVCERVSVS